MINKALNYFSFVLLLSTISLTGCASAPKDAMTMITAKKGEVKISLAGTGTAVIDWGDDSASENG